jgi:hypothetical protein
MHAHDQAEHILAAARQLHPCTTMSINAAAPLHFAKHFSTNNRHDGGFREPAVAVTAVVTAVNKTASDPPPPQERGGRAVPCACN